MALAVIKSPGHSEIDYLEAKENHLADISARNATLKSGRSSHVFIMDLRDTFPTDNRIKWPKKTNSWPQNRRDKNINPKFIGLIKENSSGLDQTTTPSYPENLNFPLLTNVHA